MKQIWGFSSILEYIHDQPIDLDGIRHDHDRLTIPVEVIDTRRKLEEKTILLLLRRITYPVVHASLEITNVLRFEIIDKSQVGYPTVNEFQFIDQKNLVLLLNEDAAISMYGEKMEVCLRVPDDYFRTKRYFVSRFYSPLDKLEV